MTQSEERDGLVSKRFLKKFADMHFFVIEYGLYFFNDAAIPDLQ